MTFRLIYRGPLPSAAGDNRVKIKHQIRQAVHWQLKELWRVHWQLRHITPHRVNDHLTKRQFGYNFISLLNNDTRLVCKLSITFLRRDEPGQLIQSGGDIDNRIKVLFDALRVPQNATELDSGAPADGEDPFYCLLEDDKLITDVRVTTDRLLTPLAAGEKQNDVHLIIKVDTASLDFPTV